jgi:pimeloyl-ACP methyl ester carboxylesterase
MTELHASARRSSNAGDLMSLLDERFPARGIAADDGVISWRECGRGPVVVLLHGIGSGAPSWLPCALALERDARVIAWNAPGYGASTSLGNKAPAAADYASALRQLLDGLEVERCVLVGHSLGAMMAAAYAAADAPRIANLVLLSPAQGYGSPEKQARRQQVEAERLTALETVGVGGMAARAPERMLSPKAGEEAREWVRWNMGLLDPAGYTQAVRMLCGDEIRNYLRTVHAAQVHCGAADSVTTPEDSRKLAEEFEFHFGLIDDAGHACYVERPEAVANIIRQLI